MPRFQGSLDAIARPTSGRASNRKTIFAPNVEAVRRAFTDAGRDVPDDLAARALGGRDVQV